MYASLNGQIIHLVAASGQNGNQLDTTDAGLVIDPDLLTCHSGTRASSARLLARLRGAKATAAERSFEHECREGLDGTYSDDYAR